MIEDTGLHIGLVGPLPPPFGGMANQTRQLRDLLISEGIKVTLIQTNSPYSPGILEKLKGVRAFFRLLSFVFKVWRLADKVDVIHVLANSGWSWQLFSAPVVWIGWLRKIPVIVNYRGGEAANYFRQSFKWVRPTMNKARLIAVPSGYLKRIFADYGFEAQVIPNIINTDRFRPAANHETPSDKMRHLIVTRNLETIYGLTTAVRAVSLLKERIPEIKLSIAGSGPQKEELQHLVKQFGLENNVVFTGKLEPDEVASLCRHAGIMLNPTTADNMPNSVLEAMACGLPVVTTNVGGIPDIVEHERTALFVPVNDPQAMAHQVKTLLETPGLYRKLVMNGLEEVKQYAWPSIKKQWLGVYRQLQKQG